MASELMGAGDLPRRGLEPDVTGFLSDCVVIIG